MKEIETPQDAVESGQKALGPTHGYPWYDPAKDGIRRVELPADQDGGRGSSGSDSVLGPFIYILAWTVLAILLAAIFYLILKALAQRKRLPKQARRESAAAEKQRVEALPFVVEPPSGDLLEEARRNYQQGDFGRAIVYLFSHQLVQLDKHHLIRLARGKTNRQYLREVGSRAPLRELVGQTLVAFEDVFFGHHPLDQPGFEACWSRLGEFQSMLGQEA